MMSLKDDFLKIKTYEEYDQKREAFKDLDYSDKEIFEHWGNLFPKLKKSGWEDGIIVEAYKTLSYRQSEMIWWYLYTKNQ